jgi:hypothetical protein
MASPKSNSWRSWYSKNKETYNARRKKRRDQDPEYREKLAEKQRDYRQSKPSKDEDAPRMKKVGHTMREVFRIGDAARACHRSIQAIRIWEREGKIPRPSVPGGHRYYTRHQIDLMVELAEVLDAVRYDPSVRTEVIDAKCKEVHQQWKHYPKKQA